MLETSTHGPVGARVDDGACASDGGYTVDGGRATEAVLVCVSAWLLVGDSP
jgi:hypothetical protein